MKIITNNQPRYILGSIDLTEEERVMHDILDEDEGSFFRYLGWVYNLNDFMRGTGDKNWDASLAETYGSGILIKVCEDGDSLIAARYSI